MESQYKDSDNGVTNGGEEEFVAVANKRKMVGWGLFLRAAAAALSLAAAVVLSLDNQTTMVALRPRVIVPVTAKWHYLSAFVYFVVANAIASVYGTISLLLTLASSRGGKRRIVVVVVVSDLVTAALLFSSFGAAAAVGLIGREGNSHVQWRKVCDVFDKFCMQGAAALLLSGGASVMFFTLVVVAIFNLHNKN
ncbi:CASP-like protein 1E2 [Salvia miltiorrhiza]|uniref:CASP-like protein 1E2 n=1 Tax=Salvia miltiorrhiza TaxID=226208 RepID=UPI0025AB8681|nr:CASP-like protein 1E2 [Salvia miltiorrhiza]